MLKFVRALFANALLFAATFVVAQIIPPGEAVTAGQIAANNGSLPTKYHNAPIVITEFTTDQSVRLIMGANVDPIAGTMPEYYWLTNSGDPVSKPRITFTISRPDVLFYDTATTQTATSVELNQGETGVFSQEFSGQNAKINFTRYNSQGDNIVLPVATSVRPGAIKAAGNIAVSADGTPTVTGFSIQNGTVTSPPVKSTDVANKSYVDTKATPSIPFSIAGIDSTASKVWVAKYTTGTSHGDAPLQTDIASQYLQLGGTEWGVNSVRGIGFGYVPNNKTFAPGFIGYTETSKTGNTMGDLYFATRDSTGVFPPTEKLRITAGAANAYDIRAGASYAPKTATSLATKGYVDGAVTGHVGSFITNPNASVVLQKFMSGDWLALNKPSGAQALSFSSVATYTAAGIPIGSRIRVTNWIADGVSPVNLTSAAVVYTTPIDPPTTNGNKNLVINNGETYEFQLASAGWYAVRVDSGTPITATGGVVISNGTQTLPATTPYDQMVIGWTGLTNLNMPTVAAFQAAGKQFGYQFTLVNQIASPINVVFQENVYGPQVNGKTLKLFPNDMFTVKLDSAQTWRLIPIQNTMFASGPTGKAPAYLDATKTGFRYFNTTTNKTSYWSGSAWVTDAGAATTP